MNLLRPSTTVNDALKKIHGLGNAPNVYFYFQNRERTTNCRSNYCWNKIQICPCVCPVHNLLVYLTGTTFVPRMSLSSLELNTDKMDFSPGRLGITLPSYTNFPLAGTSLKKRRKINTQIQHVGNTLSSATSRWECMPSNENSGQSIKPTKQWEAGRGKLLKRQPASVPVHPP